MRRIVLVSAGTGKPVCDPCELATRPWSRMRGLLGRAGLAPGHGMLFSHTSSIHTFFMRFPIDVVFLDRELEVIAVSPAVDPWKTAKAKGAKWVLELAAGEAERLGLEPGTQLVRVER